MSELYLILLVVSIAVILVGVMIKGERIFEFPYFMAAVFAGFILPQAFSLVRFPGKVGSGAVEGALLMTCLCLFACVIGYTGKPSIWLIRKINCPVFPHKMLHVGAFFVLCGYIFGFLLSQIRLEFNMDRGGMTGLGTIYIFFASLKYPGLAIALSMVLQRVTMPRLVLLILAVISPAGEVILGGRREPAVALAMIILFCLYFYRRKKPSRILIFGALFLALLAIPATGVYRNLVAEGGIKQLRQLDLIGNFKDYFGKESVLELRNAAAIIETRRRYGGYDYGAGYWNQMIFRFVPAQLVGKEMKDTLVLGGTVEDMFKRYSETGYEFSIGSTPTGMGDSFRQFGWFGCLFFAVLGWFFRSIWISALQPNAMFAQLLYLLICTSAMRALTHQTVDFLPGFTYQFVFLWAGLWYAADRGQRVLPRSSRGRVSRAKPLCSPASMLQQKLQRDKSSREQNDRRPND